MRKNARRSSPASQGVKLVRIPLGSTETVYWLEERLAEARRGELIGIAAICMYSHSDYGISIRGEIRKSPVYTRGLLPELDHELGRILRSK